jgi:hypothetical protein
MRLLLTIVITRDFGLRSVADSADASGFSMLFFDLDCRLFSFFRVCLRTSCVYRLAGLIFCFRMRRVPCRGAQCR